MFWDYTEGNLQDLQIFSTVKSSETALKKHLGP